MEEMAMVDLRSDTFAKRLANLLVGTRSVRGRSVRQMARMSDGSFTKSQLKSLESANTLLDDDLVARVTELYESDLGAILPTRLAVVVGTGIVSAGGVSTAFVPHDSTALLEAYLNLVRSMRRQMKAPAVDLRRDDIEVLAGYLQQPGETIVERLAALMGASRTQRTAMIGLFASGAVVIGLVGTAMAAGGAVTHRDSMGNGPLFGSGAISMDIDHDADDAGGAGTNLPGDQHGSLHAANLGTQTGNLDADADAPARPRRKAPRRSLVERPSTPASGPSVKDDLGSGDASTPQPSTGPTVTPNPGPPPSAPDSGVPSGGSQDNQGSSGGGGDSQDNQGGSGSRSGSQDNHGDNYDAGGDREYNNGNHGKSGNHGGD